MQFRIAQNLELKNVAKTKAAKTDDGEAYYHVEEPDGDDTAPVANLPTSRETFAVGESRFRVIKRVTQRALSLQDNIIYYIKINAPFFSADPLPEVYNPKKMPPPTMLEITDLETGECLLLICNTVFVSEIERKYSDGGYVGCCFAVKRHPAAKENKAYKLFDIVEISEEA